jgi:hypothetical protein
VFLLRSTPVAEVVSFGERSQGRRLVPAAKRRQSEASCIGLRKAETTHGSGGTANATESAWNRLNGIQIDLLGNGDEHLNRVE